MSASTHPCRLRLIAPPIGSEPPPRLWFAILTYNALAYTRRCLASLDRHTGERWHAVILDNTSTDGTREWLASLDDPRLTVELGNSNLGVAGGRNRLLEIIGDRVSDDGFVVFVDNDLEFHPGWDTPFLKLLDHAPRVGIASVTGHEIVVHGDRRDLLSLPGHVAMPVDVSSGGFACFVRPAAFRDIGRYDEALNPFWHEDDDISVRALQAGWDVWAVPTSPVIHHGHKSGVALPALIQGGSLQKQRYLIEKWRGMDVVGSDGVLRTHRPDATATTADAWTPTLAERLGARLGRAHAMRRSEFERATLDIALLAESISMHGAIASRARYASAPALAILEERAASGGASAPDERVRAEIVQLRDTRRRTSRLAPRPTGSAAPRALCRLADAADFDLAPWFDKAITFAADGRGAQQWFDRTLATWRATQAAVALEALGLLDGNRRLLFVTDVRSPLVWGVANVAREVVVADVLDRYPEAGNGLWLDRPERFATRHVPNDRVRAVALDALLSTPAGALTGSRFDAAVLLPWNDGVTLADSAALLTALAAHVQPGAPLLTCLPVRLAGPPNSAVLDGPAALARWLAPLGLAPIGSVDMQLGDEGLLAATDAGASGRRAPDLLVADGPRLSGALFVVATALPDTTRG